MQWEIEIDGDDWEIEMVVSGRKRPDEEGGMDGLGVKVLVWEIEGEEVWELRGLGRRGRESGFWWDGDVFSGGEVFG